MRRLTQTLQKLLKTGEIGRHLGLITGTAFVVLMTASAAWRLPNSRLSICATGGGVVSLFLLWQLPKSQVAFLRKLTPEDRFDRENEARKTLSQILGGIVLLIGLYFSWRSLELTKQNLNDSETAAQATLRIASEGQITDRFTVIFWENQNNQLLKGTLQEMSKRISDEL
jgi:hypothetical protein